MWIKNASKFSQIEAFQNISTWIVRKLIKVNLLNSTRIKQKINISRKNDALLK